MIQPDSVFCKPKATDSVWLLRCRPTADTTSVETTQLATADVPVTAMFLNSLISFFWLDNPLKPTRSCSGAEGHTTRSKSRFNTEYAAAYFCRVMRIAAASSIGGGTGAGVALSGLSASLGAGGGASSFAAGGGALATGAGTGAIVTGAAAFAGSVAVVAAGTGCARALSTRLGGGAGVAVRVGAADSRATLGAG